MKRVLVGVPNTGTLPVETVQCLFGLKSDLAQIDVWFESLSLVYVARERIVEKAIAEEYDYVMFIDSDMVFSPDLVDRLLSADKDIVTGLAFMRLPPYLPCIYDTIKIGDVGENIIHTFRSLPDGLTRIEGCGMACCLVKTEVFKAVRKKHLCFNPAYYLGEDLAFCVRARIAGFQIYCDTSVRVGHLGKQIVTEDTWHKFNGN